ncbi:MAG: O-antigen ligase family protein [Saprospiraceae bacterium]
MPDYLKKQCLTLLKASSWSQANLAAFGLMVWFFAMPWSLFLLTLSMILLSAITFIQGPADTINGRWKLQLPWAGTSKAFWQDSRFMPLVLLFILPIVNAVATENWAEWWVIMRVHLAYLVLPLVFFCLPALQVKHFRFLVIWVLIISFLSSGVFVINYVLHFDEFQAKLGMGQPIDMPVSHIRYSLFVAMSILSAIWLLLKYSTQLQFLIRRLLLILILLTSCFLFILAIRSGIVALLIGVLVLGVLTAWERKKWALLLGTIFLVGSLPIAAYYMLPSFKQKIHYALYDINLLSNDGQNDASDHDRFNSLKYGWELAKKAPLNGVGLADLRTEIEALHLRDSRKVEVVKLPHNQFIYYLSGAGMTGLLLFCLAFFWPFYRNRKSLNAYSWCFLLVVLSSFMVEYNLETSLGAAFFLGFWALALNKKGF